MGVYIVTQQEKKWSEYLESDASGELCGAKKTSVLVVFAFK